MREKVILYTDASGATFRQGIMGAVLFTAEGNYWATGNVPYFPLKTRSTYIGVFETLAVLASLATFRSLMRECDLLIFIDNVEAQHAVVSGFTGNEDTAILAFFIWRYFCELNIRVWVERVDSESNVADLPTRLNDLAEDILNGLNCVQTAFASYWEEEVETALEDLTGDFVV